MIRKAEEFHGHLGPFLVIGVRMGITISKLLGADVKRAALEILINVPLVAPFSCVIDGIQVTTQCTIGNRKLKAENSTNEIVAQAKIQGTSATIKIMVNEEIIKMLNGRISEGVTNETLAREIALLPETQLFFIERR